MVSNYYYIYQKLRSMGPWFVLLTEWDSVELSDLKQVDLVDYSQCGMAYNNWHSGFHLDLVLQILHKTKECCNSYIVIGIVQKMTVAALFVGMMPVNRPLM